MAPTLTNSSEAHIQALSGIREITAFDANAYRGFVHGKPMLARARAAKLVAAERANGIRAMAMPQVIVELASHLADPVDPAYAICVAALSAMWVHCNWDSEGPGELAFLADTESQICRSLYGELPEGHILALDALNDLVGQIHADPRPEALAQLQDTFDQCKRVADQFEARFVEVMNGSFDGFDLENPEVRRDLRRSLDSDESLLIAGVHTVLRARLLLHLEGDDPEVGDRAKAVRDNFRTPVRLHVHKLRQIVRDRMDISVPRQRNSVWDIDYSFVIAQTANGRPVRLVTSDAEIAQIAAEAGDEKLVETLDSYLRRLGVIA